MRKIIAIALGKILRFLCRVLKRGGTGLPGRYALKVCPDLLGILSKDVKCIVVTGTNGKTTSVKMIEHGLDLAGLSYFANLTGANLIEGIATDFIMNSTLSGKCRKEYAVLETDEFASKEVCRYLQPEVIFVTNLFVDQVERFGGVHGTRDGIAIAVKNSPKSTLVLNADDSVSASLALNVPNPVVYYGISKDAALSYGYSGSSDVKECIECGELLEFDYMTFSHLGSFKCPKCGYSHPAVNYSVNEILEANMDQSLLNISTPDGDTRLCINLPEMYNMYNGLGAFAAMRCIGITADVCRDALSTFTCGFGRMETFDNLGKCGGKMVLVKNGAGCDQVLQFLKKYDEDFVLCIYLNNNVSDGVDITWLQTADFEALHDCRVKYIYVSGMRAKEMHERLLKAGISETMMEVETDTPSLISKLNESNCPVFILPTYTGMMAARSEIVKQCGGKEYWEGK